MKGDSHGASLKFLERRHSFRTSTKSLEVHDLTERARQLASGVSQKSGGRLRAKRHTMADRQYGIPTGYREGDDRPQMQPIEAYNAMQAQQYRHYPPSAQKSTQRSPPRRPVAPYERKAVPVPPSSKPPPPPAHQDTYSQYGHHGHQSSTTPDEDSYGPRAVDWLALPLL